MPVDDERVAAHGIRKLAGEHLTLYTDLPAADDVDELPLVFDKAVPQWCEYFGVDPVRAENWRMTAFLMADRDRFHAAELWSPELPQFLHGYQLGYELWLNEQPSAYYRRHLLLHEGTHGFMNLLLGGTGAPWYMEGIAELLGTHRWSDGQLTLRYFPKDREETPEWGRIKIIKDEFAAGRGMTLTEILKYNGPVFLRNEPYAWCWGATAFFDNHPDYQQTFRSLRQEVRDNSSQFSQRFYDRLREQWPQINEQWQLFVIDMEYGYDVARAAVQYKAGQPLPAAGATVTVAADRGWQSSGVRVEAGVTYRITASGRYQVADQPKVWWCEPGGVTIRYQRGQPLGLLLAAVRDNDHPPEGLTPLASPAAIGLERTITFDRPGTLFFRINESAATLADNAGQLSVRVTANVN